MRIFWLVATAGLLLAASGAAAQQDGPLGPLLGALDEVPNAPWTGELANGTYTLTNTTDSDAYTLFMTPAGKSVGQRRVSADVEIVEGDILSHAGILVSYREDPFLFYFWALEPGGWVTLWRLTSESADYLTSTQTDAVVEGGINTLEVHEAANQLSLYVNDTLVGLIGGLEGMGEGRFGIAVWGTGRYVFHGYREMLALPDRAD